MGHNVVDAIVATRIEKGKFKNFNDFLSKVPQVVCTKKTVESLIKAGAFDSMNHTRRSLHDIHIEAVDSQAVTKRNEAQGQIDLFAGMFEEHEAIGIPIPDRAEWGKKEKLAFEREMLGLYVSDHPLAGREAQILRYSELTLSEFKENERLQDGQVITLAGLVTGVEHKVARNSGNPYAIVKLEDLDSELTVMLMGKTYLEFGKVLTPDQFAMIRGRVSQRDDGRNLNAQRVQVIDAPGDDSNEPVILNLRDNQATKVNLEDLDRTLRAYPGGSEVFINLIDSSRNSNRYKLQPTVKFNVGLIAEIKSIFGTKVFIGGDELFEGTSGSFVGTLVVDQGFGFGSDQSMLDFDDNNGVSFN